ncbi:hypothetical protein CEV31_2090 [Brucella thiophenivorans]|uniref:Uncharacterized protein n=1 Tax=Brucella thiophenivorans TaxID=571255 RepID=A0A256FVL2_9HYPH|nr:hypothetical protein CEV31_2090 [Brucella thiophenivorans]
MRARNKERIPKSVKRFSDKMRAKNKKTRAEHKFGAGFECMRLDQPA